MHATFPASHKKKVYWREKGKSQIMKVSKKADLVVISHYHWDHFLPKDLEIYENKILFVKNPNEYINDTQRKRALDFFSRLAKIFGGSELKFRRQGKKRFKDIGKDLRSAEKDFGDYTKRRKELLWAGKNWFRKRVERWKEFKRIPEFNFPSLKTIYPEGREFKFGKTKLRFVGPLFHGIEYSRVGWVFSTLVEYEDEKFLHSSDLNGPVIEDYADFIIRENPQYLILDGPMTYMLGYTLNLINFSRVLANVKRIVEEADFKLMIWDHHLPREARFRERSREIWDLAKKLKKNVLTASEFQLGKRPVAEKGLIR